MDRELINKYKRERNIRRSQERLEKQDAWFKIFCSITFAKDEATRSRQYREALENFESTYKKS
jgi:hypothetical protein